MKKNIIYLTFLFVILASCSKEKGAEMTVGRLITNETLIKSNSAYPYAKAVLDSVLEKATIIDSLLPGQTSTKKDTLVRGYAKLEAYFYDIDSLRFLKAGFCWSTTNAFPEITNSEYRYTVKDSTIFEENMYEFTMLDSLRYLKTDTRYYLRSFVIARDLRSGRVDTGYNQNVLDFRTRIAEDVWFYKKPFSGLSRSEAATFVIDNIMYMAGGENGSYPLNDLWAYNPNTDSWTQPALLPTPRARGVAFAIIGKADYYVGYIGLGIIDAQGTPSDKFEIYSPEHNTWDESYRKFEGGARHDAVAFTLTGADGRPVAYVGFGCNDIFKQELNAYVHHPASDLYKYNIKADTAASLLTWNSVGVSGLPTYGIVEACATSIGNRAYIFGGYKHKTADGTGVKEYQKNLFIYDNLSNQEIGGNFAIIGDFPGLPRANAAMFSLSFTKDNQNRSFIYFGTGRTADADGKEYYLNDFWGFDLQQASWVRLSNYKGDACEGAIGFHVKKNHDDYGLNVLDRGYIGTGRTAKKLSNEIWEYLP